MRKGLVTTDGRIVEVRDNAFEVHPDMKWVDVPDSAVYGDRIENGRFVPAPLPAPGSHRPSLLDRIVALEAEVAALKAVKG